MVQGLVHNLLHRYIFLTNCPFINVYWFSLSPLTGLIYNLLDTRIVNTSLFMTSIYSVVSVSFFDSQISDDFYKLDKVLRNNFFVFIFVQIYYFLYFVLHPWNLFFHFFSYWWCIIYLTDQLILSFPEFQFDSFIVFPFLLNLPISIFFKISPSCWMFK